MTDRLDGRRVVVTGAAGGIGGAIASLAAERGADLVLVDLNEEHLGVLVERVGGTPHVMDVGDPVAWEALAASTGDWDDVFLNAGIMSAPPDAPLDASSFLTLDLERYRRIVSVNVDGVAFGLRAAIPKLQARGGGIVVTASAAGLIPYPLDPAYAMTKHAVVGLVRSLAPTLSGNPPVRLCAICPGGVQTDLVPSILRGVTTMMNPRVVAEEALDLCLHGRNGEVRGRFKTDEPARSFDPPAIDLV